MRRHTFELPAEVLKSHQYLREMMDSLKATEAIVVFDGQGDSGWGNIYGVKIKGKIWKFGSHCAESRTVEEPSVRGMFAVHGWTGNQWGTRMEETTRTFGDLALDVFGHFMDHEYAGWENNEGAYGELTITDELVTLKFTPRTRYTGKEISKKRRPATRKGTEVNTYEVPVSAMEHLTDQLKKED